MEWEPLTASAKPIVIEFMKYSNYEDALKIAEWIGRPDTVEIDMSQGAHGLTRIEYLVPGAVGTTKEITFKLGDVIVKDLGFHTFSEPNFRARYEKKD